MAFIASVEQMAAQLKDLDSPVSDLQIMAKIIMSLPPSFRHFHSAWDSVASAEKTITNLTSRLIKEEKMTKLYNKGQFDPLDAAYFAGNLAPPFQPRTSNDSQHLAAQGGSFRGNYRGGYRGNGRGNRGGRGNGRSWVVCHYCNIPGHVTAVCRKRIRAETNQTQSQGPSNNNRHQDFGYSSIICFSARR